MTHYYYCEVLFMEAYRDVAAGRGTRASGVNENNRTRVLYTYRAFSRWIATDRRSLRINTLSARRRIFFPNPFPCRNISGEK